VIDSLIDKQDTFEIVRDQIAFILASESVSQMALAVLAAKDPDDWKLNVYTERSNAFEQFLSEDPEPTPIVNIWYDNSNFDKSSSNIMERQKSETIYNIDCYGYGVASSDGGSGHNPGDREAAFEVQRTLRLVRNILMAATYTHLDLQGIVWTRWTQSITAFQPELSGTQYEQVQAIRLALQVDFNEFSPQVTPEELELIHVDVKRTGDGKIIVDAEYDYTL